MHVQETKGLTYERESRTRRIRIYLLIWYSSFILRVLKPKGKASVNQWNKDQKENRIVFLLFKSKDKCKSSHRKIWKISGKQIEFKAWFIKHFSRKRFSFIFKHLQLRDKQLHQWTNCTNNISWCKIYYLQRLRLPFKNTRRGWPFPLYHCILVLWHAAGIPDLFLERKIHTLPLNCLPYQTLLNLLHSGFCPHHTISDHPQVT